MEPVWGAVFAFLIPDIVTGQTESFDAYKILGCTLMFLGMICCELGSILKKKFLGIWEKNKDSFLFFYFPEKGRKRREKRELIKTSDKT